MKKKTHSVRIGIVTGSRADYGLLRPVYDALKRHRNVRPLLFVTGMHLLPEFGLSWRHINVPITAKIPMYSARSPVADAAVALSAAFSKEKLDHLILLGDRREMLAGALAAFESGIPISHIHGGDAADSGHVDELIRPIISLLSTLHFPASKRSRERLLSLGVEATRITVSGSPALDAVASHAFRSESATRKMLGIATRRYAVVAFHPNDRDQKTGGHYMRIILQTLRKNPKRSLVIIYPNNDDGNQLIITEIEKRRGKSGIRIFKTMPQGDFLDTLKHADFLIGNSSGGIYECSLLLKPAINVGTRNRGREHGANLVDADPTPSSITRSLKRIESPSFKRRMVRDRYRFGHGHAAERIVSTIVKKTLHVGKI